jgi:CheY-like chemotaxis protein
MNSILGFAQVLARKVEPDQRKSVDHILKAGRHLLNLINEVLDIARIESNKMQISPEPVRVSHVVQETLSLIHPLAAQRHCIVKEHIVEHDNFYVLADRQRLTQVLLNIVSNGVKYNGEGGVVSLACKTVEGHRLRIEITDTGPGLSEAQMARVFSPFDRLGAEQSNIEGTGLGLALSKGLVEVMGGKMGVESTLGQGCTFWVELSMIESPQQRLARTREGSLALPELIPARKASTVLYIEDNLANLSLIEVVLADRQEITLLSSLQGQLGLELAWEHQPDLILLDLHLPDISGDEVLARLRRDPRSQEIPVIVISADATSSHIKDILSAGAQFYLTKPLDVDEFLAKLDELLESNGK